MEVWGPLSDFENNVQMKKNIQTSMHNEQVHAKYFSHENISKY